MFDYPAFFEQQIYDTKEKGNYRVFRKVKKKVGNYPLVVCEDKPEVINFTGNDYLGMSTHHEVVAEMNRVALEEGVGSGGTRNISGTSAYHQDLEKKVAKLHNKERGVVFNSAYLANVASIGVLGKILPDCVIFSDALNHASIIEGIKLSGARKEIFRHNDVAHLEALLEKHKNATTKLIIFESVYSMHGTIGEIQAIITLAKKYHALTFLDEVHAVGLYGQHGGGITEEQGNANQIDVISGTFAKGFGVVGGYVVGTDLVMDTVRCFGAGFIFTTSVPPALVAAAIKSIDIVSSQRKKREDFFANVRFLKSALAKKKMEFLNNHSHIIGVPIGDSKKCAVISNHLLQKYGIYVQAVNYPTVPMGEELLRITLTPLHQKEQLNYLVDSLEKTINSLN